MVHLNSYSVEIVSNDSPVRNFIRDRGNYVALRHNSEYKLEITNNRGTRCDVVIWIDDEKVGVWRLDGYQSATIERPVGTSRRFTFVREGSQQARFGEIVTGNTNNGLIKAVFTPEKRQRTTNYPVTYGTLNTNSALSFGKQMLGSDSLHNFSNYQSGGTVLGNLSNQRFNTVAPLRSIDHDNVTTLYTRLVVDEDDYEPPIVPLRTVREHTTSIPKPLTDFEYCDCLPKRQKQPWDH